MPKLSIELFLGILGIVVAFALYMLEKSGRGGAIVNGVLLIVMAGLLIYPALSIPWIYSTPQVAWKIWRGTAIIGGVILAVGAFGIWTWPRPSKDLAWNPDIAHKEKASRTFWLLREPGAAISLDCPGPKCMRFQLGQLKQEKDDHPVQEIILTGEGFARHPPRPGYLVDFDNPVLIKGGGTSFSIPFGNSPMVATLGLKLGAEIQMSTKYADITLSVLDVKIDSLRIRLLVVPPSTPDTKTSPH